MSVNYDAVRTMLSYVEWTHPFIVCSIFLMLCLTGLLVFCLLTKSSKGYLMIFITSLLLASQLANEYVVDNYEFLGLSPKVIESGYFIFIFWSLPLSILLIMLMVSYVLDLISFISET